MKHLCHWFDASNQTNPNKRDVSKSLYYFQIWFVPIFLVSCGRYTWDSFDEILLLCVNNEHNLDRPIWCFVLRILTTLKITPFIRIQICFFFCFKNITNLLICKRHYVVMGKVFMAGVWSPQVINWSSLMRCQKVVSSVTIFFLTHLLTTHKQVVSR